MKSIKNHITALYLFLLMFPLQTICATSASVSKEKSSISISTSTLSSEPVNSGYLIQLIFGLIIVLLCIVALAWFAKRINRFQSSTDGVLKIIGGISMGSRERIVLLQVGTNRLLVGVSPGRINTLHVLDDDIENSLSQEKKLNNGFSETLKNKLASVSYSNNKPSDNNV